ncbi:hypothetical protein EFR95_05115, partial [Lactobacillus amylovorus]|nr:hypothetical protein [Lactobacillus amylovorus]
DIINIETWCNSLPRKILAYHTPDEIFEKELDHNLSSSINVQFIIAIYGEIKNHISVKIPKYDNSLFCQSSKLFCLICISSSIRTSTSSNM